MLSTELSGTNPLIGSASSKGPTLAQTEAALAWVNAIVERLAELTTTPWDDFAWSIAGKRLTGPEGAKVLHDLLIKAGVGK